MVTTKSTTPKAAAPKKPRAPRSAPSGAPHRKTTAAHKPAAEKPAVHHHKAEVAEAAPAVTPKHTTKHAADGRYIFATGRRKTSVANIRLFSGKGDSVVNKQPLKKYFAYSYYQDEIGKPFELTGLGGDYFFVCHVNGGGPHSQATAVQLGIAQALGQISEEVRKVLKKNGMLTRDDRKKERKKPGLKRARRSPQWAKR